MFWFLDGDFVLPKKLKIPKFSRPESGKIDEVPSVATDLNPHLKNYRLYSDTVGVHQNVTRCFD